MTHYVTVHLRLKNKRGPASNYSCSRGCQRVAEQWAYLYNGDPEFSWEGTLYAEDIEGCYAPMCRSCHRQFDLENDPRLKSSLQQEGARLGALTGTLKANTTSRRCGGCDMVAHPGAIGAHQSSSGHIGYTTIEPEKT